MERSKEEIHAFLSKINEDLREFITKTIKQGDYENGEWSHLFDDGKNPRCFEMLGCGKEDCPVYSSDDYRCWLQVGTLCGREAQGDFAKKFGNCLRCKVFQHYHKEPVRSLYENIDILISHLTGEVGEYRRRSITDRLTGVYNRNFFEELIGRELDKAARLNLHSSFMMTDLDGLKGINDSLGHLTGDVYLKEASKLLQNSVRYSDVVFRMGGDEFLIFLINAAAEECNQCCQRISKEIERWNSDNAPLLGAPLSISVGTSTLAPGQRDFLTAIKHADAEMYRNKAARRADR